MKQDLENGYRIFQIASLDPKKNNAKIESYSKRVLNFNMENPGLLSLWSRKFKLGDLSRTLEALENRDNRKLKMLIIFSKLKFIFNKALENPFNTFKNIYDRKNGLNIQFKKDPCGPLLFLSGNKKLLSNQLDKLVNNNILPGWSEKEDLRERGWAFIFFKEKSGKKTDYEKLLSLIVRRHEIIYCSYKKE